MQAPRQHQLLLLRALQLHQALAWAEQALAVQQQQQPYYLRLQVQPGPDLLVAAGLRHMPVMPLL
jgi:hypothetical protein